MIVTHPKIATLMPAWAPFHGCSLILDGFGAAPGGWPPRDMDDTATACFSADPATLAAFRRIATTLEAEGPDRLMRGLLLCLLPAASYHVTFADLLHQGQLDRLERGRRPALDAALAALARGAVPAALVQAGLPPGGRRTAPLRLVCTGAGTMGGRVVALEFRAESPAGPEALADLLAWRQACLDRLQAGLGVPPTSFRPHLTLGYFAAPALVPADLLQPLLARLTAALTGLVLDFDAIALYRFRSMVAFERLGV